MSDKSSALAVALKTALTTALGSTPVYDAVPPSVDHSAAFCYATYELFANNWSTKTFDGQDFGVRVHIWSSYRGFKEAREKLDLVHTALHHVTLTVTGAVCVLSEYQDTQYILDPDGLTRHGVSTFRVLLQHT